MTRIAVIGGGAAGFFAAINAKENFPSAEVVIIEKSKKTLSKVKVSGGGRCNVTNACPSLKELVSAYPRGANQLKKLFGGFNNLDTMRWFEDRNVPLVTQEDDCVFPESQDSQSIIDCFLNEAKRLGIIVTLEMGVIKVEESKGGLELTFRGGKREYFDKAVITTGGSPKREGLEWLEKLGHEIIDPVPSLFTFNMPNEAITSLMGVVVENAQVKILSTKIKCEGPLLITHWGMSGPAILKSSAFGARLLFEKGYQFTIQVNWVNISDDQQVLNELTRIALEFPNRNLSNVRPYYLPERLWKFLLKKCALSETIIWKQMGDKVKNKLVNILTNDQYSVKGKTTFKEEFVTCGGVSLSSVDMSTMQSKVCPNIYFAGEILNMDGITGGFNFQAAWTCAFVAGKLIQ